MDKVIKPLIAQGWLRVLLFLVPWLIITLAADYGTNWFIGLWWQGEPLEHEANLQNLFRFSVAAITTTITVLIFRNWIDRQTFASLGLAFRHYKNDAWMGFFAAPAIIGAGTLVLILIKAVQFTGLLINPLTIGLHILILMVIAWSEELVIRGYLLNNLLQSFNKWVALSITAVCFALLHLSNPDVTLLSLINIVLAGFLLGINYIYTQNLWFGIFFHFSWNFFQGPVFDYEVSGILFQGIFQQVATGPPLWTGGSFGFEGSLLCIILILIAVVLFNRFFSTRKMHEIPEGQPIS